MANIADSSIYAKRQTLVGRETPPDPGSIENSPRVTIDHSENSFFRQVHTISRKCQRSPQSFPSNCRVASTNRRPHFAWTTGGNAWPWKPSFSFTVICCILVRFIILSNELFVLLDAQTCTFLPITRSCFVRNSFILIAIYVFNVVCKLWKMRLWSFLFCEQFMRPTDSKRHMF